MPKYLMRARLAYPNFWFDLTGFFGQPMRRATDATLRSVPPEQRFQILHHGMGYNFGSGRGRMEPIRLHQILMPADAIEQKRYPDEFVLLCQIHEHLFERVYIFRSIVAGQSHPGDDHLSVFSSEGFNHTGHIRPGQRDRLTPQAIVAPEFQDNDRRMQRQDRRQPFDSIRRGISANPHINNAIPVSGRIDQPLQTVWKTLAGVQPEACRETIPERRNHRTRIC